MSRASTRSAPASRLRGDAELVAACIDGDAKAWDALVAAHGSLVWAIARRAGLSEADAAEVFQNTWTIALEDLPRVRDASRFDRWLGRVARHQALRVRRGYGIARTAHARVAREDIDRSRPDEPLEQLEDRHRVQRALTHVGERCRDLIRLLYFEQPTPAYQEIAASLGMRIGSIGPTRARCLAKLESRLEEGNRE